MVLIGPVSPPPRLIETREWKTQLQGGQIEAEAGQGFHFPGFGGECEAVIGGSVAEKVWNGSYLMGWVALG